MTLRRVLKTFGFTTLGSIAVLCVIAIYARIYPAPEPVFCNPLDQLSYLHCPHPYGIRE